MILSKPAQIGTEKSSPGGNSHIHQMGSSRVVFCSPCCSEKHIYCALTSLIDLSLTMPVLLTCYHPETTCDTSYGRLVVRQTPCTCKCENDSWE